MQIHQSNVLRLDVMPADGRHAWVVVVVGGVWVKCASLRQGVCRDVHLLNYCTTLQHYAEYLCCRYCCRSLLHFTVAIVGDVK